MKKFFSLVNMLRKQKNPIGLRWFILLVQVKFDNEFYHLR